MGASPSPTIDNIFLNYFETVGLAECPDDFKPKFYRRYLDDMFLIFSNEQQAKHFFNYINSRHSSIKFTIAGEIDGTLAFLDVNVNREGNKFTTSVYQKEIFTGQGMNFLVIFTNNINQLHYSLR